MTTTTPMSFEHTPISRVDIRLPEQNTSFHRPTVLLTLLIST